MSTRAEMRTDRAQRAQPESLRARSLSTALTVTDLATSLGWYCDIVGFTLDERYEREGKMRGASLKAGEVRIVLS